MRLKKDILVATACVALLTVALPGCGERTPNADVNTPASTTPGQALPPARVITGVVTYAGTAKSLHQIIVVASRSGEQSPAFSTVIKQPGTYTISGVTDGSYFLSGFMDMGDDMGPPGATEPFGYYDANGDGRTDEVVMNGGKGLAGINIDLQDAK
jgi:hypothetical protein